jgi:hypothetical protein
MPCENHFQIVGTKHLAASRGGANSFCKTPFHRYLKTNKKKSRALIPKSEPCIKAFLPITPYSGRVYTQVTVTKYVTAKRGGT